LAITSHSVGIVTINVSMLRRTCPLVKDAPNYPSSQTVPIQTDKRECRKNILSEKITLWYIITREKRIFIIRETDMILQTAILLNLTKKYSCIQNFRVQEKLELNGLSGQIERVRG
jgi:hypothetical protein